MLSYDGAAVSGPAFVDDADTARNCLLTNCIRRGPFMRRTSVVKGVQCLPLQLGAP